MKARWQRFLSISALYMPQWDPERCINSGKLIFERAMKTSCCDVFNASDGNPLCTCCDDSETGCLGLHVVCEEYRCPLQSSVVDLTFFGSYQVGGLHHHSDVIFVFKDLDMSPYLPVPKWCTRSHAWLVFVNCISPGCLSVFFLTT